MQQISDNLMERLGQFPCINTNNCEWWRVSHNPLLRDGSYRRMVKYHIRMTGPNKYLDVAGNLNILAG